MDIILAYSTADLLYMPLIKSAIKRAKQNKVRKARLLPYRTNAKTMVRRILDLVKEGKKDEAVKALSDAFKAIDMACKKGILHRKTADRRKSRLARVVA
jgi:small subunit ribosomal protein S20